MKAGKLRYQAGYDNDPGIGFYIYNYKPEAPGGYRGPVTPPEASQGSGRHDNVPWGAACRSPTSTAIDEGSRWWMTEAEAIPYSAEADDEDPGRERSFRAC